VWSIGNVGGQFDAAVDRTWGEYEEFGACAADAFGVHPEEGGVFSNGGKERATLTFELHSKEIDAVDFREDLVEVKGDFDAELSDFAGDQSCGAADDDASPEFDEAMDVGAGDAAVTDVTNQSNGESGDASAVSADGVDIEESLSGMFVSAIAGVED
jgi:hypothetical protein